MARKKGVIVVLMGGATVGDGEEANVDQAAVEEDVVEVVEVEKMENKVAIIMREKERRVHRHKPKRERRLKWLAIHKEDFIHRARPWSTLSRSLPL